MVSLISLSVTHLGIVILIPLILGSVNLEVLVSKGETLLPRDVVKFSLDHKL